MNYFKFTWFIVFPFLSLFIIWALYVSASVAGHAAEFETMIPFGVIFSIGLSAAWCHLLFGGFYDE